MKLALPEVMRAEILGHARAAAPGECCGLIEGERAGELFRVTALHPARNLAQAADRFEIDPADHFAASRAARQRARAIIGCYHSHPGGEAWPSAHDKARAGQEDFLWLIAAPGGLGAFVYRSSGFEGVVLTDALGADLVTSSSNDRS